jgi:hypothetical protein
VRAGVIGRIVQDYFAANVADALQLTGQAVTHLSYARRLRRYQMFGRIATTVRKGLPRLDEQLQQRISRAAEGACCERAMSPDVPAVSDAVGQFRLHSMRVSSWLPDAVSGLGRWPDGGAGRPSNASWTPRPYIRALSLNLEKLSLATLVAGS